MLDTRDLWIALAFAAACAGLRVIGASTLDVLPAHFAPDEPVYRELAAALRSAGSGDERLQFVSPLYPLVIAWLGSARAVVLLQLALGSAVAPALYLGTRSAGGDRRAALFAGLLVALHAPLVAFETALLPVSLAIAALAAALALSAPLERRLFASQRSAADGVRLFAVGALLALAVACAPALLPIPLLWGALLWWRVPRAAALLVALWLPLAIALTGLTVSNASLGFGASPLGANAGITFAHGNLPGATGGYRALPGSDGSKRNQHVHARDAAEREVGARLAWMEVDAYWRDRALASLAQSPARAIGLEARKAVRFATRPFLDDELGLLALREQWWLLWALPVPFPLLLGLGVLGSRRGAGAGSLAIAAGTLVTCLVFYASDRYRLPAVVGLAGPAGFALAAWTRRGGVRAAGVWAIVLLSLVGVSLLAATDQERQSAALRRAEAAEYRGDIEGALGAFGAIHADRPTLASWRGLGRNLLAADRNDEARILLGEARREHPQDARLANDHGVALLRLGRLAAAQRAFEEAKRGAPAVPEAAVNLGRVLERSARFGDAAIAHEEYTRLRPAAAAGWLGLARALQAEGRELERALDAVRRAESLASSDGERAEAWAIESLVLRDRGDPVGASARREQIEKSPDSAAAWRVLERDARRRGDRSEARSLRAAGRRAQERERRSP